MSLFSILSKAAQSRTEAGRLTNLTNIDSVIGAVAPYIPDNLRAKATRLGSVRNALGLDSRVPTNVKPEFDVDKFTSEIRKNGYVQGNRFSATINPPSQVLNEGMDRSLKMRCFASGLPGKTLMLKDDIRRHGYGMIDKVPHNTLYGDVTLSFLIDAYGEIPSLFHRWLSFINNADELDGKNLDDGNDPQQTVSYLVNYKQDYASPLEIKQMTTSYDTVFMLKMNQAYPISIGDQQLAWDQNNSVAVLPVTFTYLDYQLG